MDEKELIKGLESAKDFLDGYKAYGQMVVDAINACTRLQELLASPTEENLAEAKKITKTLESQIGPYRGFAPSLAKTLDDLSAYFGDG